MDFDYENEKFIMVSYSHMDFDIVKRDIDELRKRGVPVWYDDHMEVGDNWKHEAEKYIKRENCVGVVFYVSKWSFVSSPCENERQWYKEKPEPKFCVSVHIGGKDITGILGEVYASPEAFGKLSEEKVATNLDMFTQDKLFCARSSENVEDDSAVLEIERRAKEEGISRGFDADMERLSFLPRVSVEGSIHKLNLGEFVNSDGVRRVPKTAGEVKNRRAEDGIIYEGVKYPARNLWWILLEETANFTTLILEDVLCKRHGGARLGEWLNGEFTDIAFEGAEREIIRGKLGLATAEELDRAKVPEAVVGGKYVEWWIADVSPDGGARQQVAYGGEVWSYGWIPAARQCYVRPVLRLGKDDWQSILKILKNSEGGIKNGCTKNQKGKQGSKRGAGYRRPCVGDG